jgi:hypothetical protein
LNFLLAQSAATFAMETEEKLEPIGEEMVFDKEL